MNTLATITSLEKLRSFFSFPNELRLWRHNSITTIKLTLSDYIYDITCIDNIVSTINLLPVTNRPQNIDEKLEETICKLCELILDTFPLHFEYDANKNSYKLH